MAMARREFLKQGMAAAGAAAAAGMTSRAAAETKRPNFIVFMTDDQGYADLSCMGSGDLQTPHLDALAARGVRFTNWYSNSPVCSPSRAALLTGRYPAHAGVRQILGGHRDSPGLPADVPTIAAALKPLGYHTGHVGKWHLGAAEAFRPDQRGFDEWFGHLAGCIDFYSHVFYWGMAGGRLDPVHDLWENGREVHEDGRYFTELITEHAVDFVSRAAAGDAPFFLYVAYNAPHYPLQAPRAYVEKFAHLPWARRMIAAMLSAVDDSVGAILAALDKAGVADSTCIFFQSDNGPSHETRNWMDGAKAPFPGSSAGALKGHKFSLFEGGIRVPGLLAWPGHIPAGQVVDTPAAAMDVFPTLLEAAGGDIAKYDVDGVSLLPHVASGAAVAPRDLFWELGTQTAMRRGDWKLVLNGRLEDSEGMPPHLANLAVDPGETHNMTEQQPDTAAEMTRAAQAWRKRMGI